MDNKELSNLPKNPIEAQGMLIKAFYEKYGENCLPIIKDICAKQGCALGQKIKKKISNNNLISVAKAFSQSYDPKKIKIIALSDNKFQIQGTKCPFNLENTSRKLCEAVMEIDKKYFQTAVSDKIRLKIIKTVAEGDPICDTLYEL
jgi:hypothetical protein